MLINKIEDYKIEGKVMVSEGIKIPCTEVRLINSALIYPNNYNPNSIPHTKMKQLVDSIKKNGFCFPIVTYFNGEKFIIIDGYHRYLMHKKEYLNMSHIPCVVLNIKETERYIATVAFNKAKGFHDCELDAKLVTTLKGKGMKYDQIAKALHIELETAYRYCQLSGIAAEELAGECYSRSWEF